MPQGTVYKVGYGIADEITQIKNKRAFATGHGSKGTFHPEGS